MRIDFVRCQMQKAREDQRTSQQRHRRENLLRSLQFNFHGRLEGAGSHVGLRCIG